MNKKAFLYAVVSFVPFIGQLWWAYKVSKQMIKAEENE